MKQIVLYFLPVILLSSCIQTGVKLEAGHMDEGMEAIKVSTPNATYYYQTEAGGFSSILDNKGNDWIGYTASGQPSYPSSAASDYRGLPNLVFHGENDGAGHPGFSKCNSHISGNTIHTKTKDGKWEWDWTFYKDIAVLNILKTDTSRNFWFLYEGTPGGVFDPMQQSWGTNSDGIRTDKPDYYMGETVEGQWNMVHFSDSGSDLTFFINTLQPDTLTDIMGYLGANEGGITDSTGMVVFGFGRSKDTRALYNGSGQTFILGFYPSALRSEEDYFELIEYTQSAKLLLMNE